MPDRLALIWVPGHTGLVTRVLRAGLVTAVLLGVVAVTACSASARLPYHAAHPHAPDLLPPPADPVLTYALTANERVAAHVSNGNYAFFRVRPCQHLLIKVVLTVPAETKVTTLWLGITAGRRGYASNHPAGLRPILAHARQALTTGRHTYLLHWHVPDLKPGTSLLLISAWSSPHPAQQVEEPIAKLTLK